MAMSRKHYREVAATLKASVEGAALLPESGPAVLMTVSSIARELARQFKADNSRFEAARFFEASGLDHSGQPVW